MTTSPDDHRVLQIDAPGSTRPDLRPVDPRATASPTNDFDIVGSIDNRSVFNAATGENTPMNF